MNELLKGFIEKTYGKEGVYIVDYATEYTRCTTQYRESDSDYTQSVEIDIWEVMAWFNENRSV
jgi:hypothetical protein